ncbi:MAG: tetratricopeptide repeat protein [Parvularculaceae bacterium]
MTQTRWKTLKFLCAASAVALAGAVVAVPAPAAAQQPQCETDEKRGPAKTLDPRIGKELQRIFEELMQEERYQEALAALSQLINQRGDSMSQFEKATVYEIRGSVKASLEDWRGAQSDFQVALDTNELPTPRQNQLRYFISQLNFQLEDYQAAIRGLNAWIRTAQTCGQKVDPNAYYLLAAAYTQIRPPNYRAALDPAEKSVAALESPRKSNYDLLNLIYSELNQRTKRMALLERMINFWPSQRDYWVQLSGAYSNAGRDKDAFAVIEVAYRAGLLENESEILTLVQYYSFFDNPYRGATLMEREMEAGVVKRTVKNLQLLSQLWSQAREHKKAIPVLQEAARRSDDGELYYRLGQVLLADEQYAAAERALVNAINKGGMDRDDTGDAWMLLGTTRFSQAGPEDVSTMRRAREAFVRARGYSKSRSQAAQWVAYIDAIEDTRRRAAELEERQRIEQCNELVQRIERQQRIQQLRGGDPSDLSELASPEQLAECGLDGSSENAGTEGDGGDSEE